MERTIITTIILILSVTGYCQNRMFNIEYEIFYNTELPNTQYANLYINEATDESIYIKTSKSKESKQVKKEEDNTISIKYNSKKNKSNYLNFKQDTLISTENAFGEYYLVSEKIPNLKWELSDETKSKDSITLSKAVCEFRGRKYTAWYALEFPLKYGPWKLHGLPGLIFEIYDESRRFNWYLKKINNEPLNESVFTLDSQKDKQIDIKEFSKIKYNNNATDEKLLAKMPRGTSIVSSEVFRNEMEIKFEWEE